MLKYKHIIENKIIDTTSFYLKMI